MTKIYKLLIDSPEYPKGTEAVQDGRYPDKTTYTIYTYEYGEKCFGKTLCPFQVENRPEVWELQEETLDLRSPEAERMREEARSKRWEFIPNTAERYYMSGIKKNGIDWLCWNESGDVIDRSIWSTGNCHRTEEEALAWGEKYARYFLTE